MVVRKVTVSLEESAYEAAVGSARTAGMSLSAWLSRYATHRAKIDEGLRGVAAFEAEFGPVPRDALTAAARTLDELGVGQPVPTELEVEYGEALRRLRAEPGARNRRAA